MEPRLTAIRGGWAAVGSGWAVFGKSPEEAVAVYREAERRHEVIAARPLDSSDGSEDDRGTLEQEQGHARQEVSREAA